MLTFYTSYNIMIHIYAVNIELFLFYDNCEKNCRNGLLFKLKKKTKR